MDPYVITFFFHNGKLTEMGTGTLCPDDAYALARQLSKTDLVHTTRITCSLTGVTTDYENGMRMGA